MSYNITLTNNICNLSFHRQSLKGTVQDFIISFTEEQTDLKLIIGKAQDLFTQLIDTFVDKRVKARLVAEVEFIKINHEDEVASFHFASHQMEWVEDSEDFYERHFGKIISRLDQFNNQGSNLLVNRIKHIHIRLNVVNCAFPF